MYTQLYKQMHTHTKKMKETHQNVAVLGSKIVGNFYCPL